MPQNTQLSFSPIQASKQYEIIVTDPPWSYYGSTDGWGDAAKEYKCMTDEEILAYRYPLAKKGILFMWATSPRLDFALKCIESHGLTYRGIAFAWIKTTKNGVPLRAQGVKASITKPLIELVLAASYCKKGRPLPLAVEDTIQTVFAPKARHSQKPEEVQNRIERMYPELSKAEFFARRHRLG